MSCCENPLVVVLMGSESDWDTMQRTHKVLADFGVPHVCRVLSAHRTPELLAAFVKETEAKGAEVFIAGAGLAAALPGAVAALTAKPVLGVPIQAGALNGHDALLAMAQMPPGIPVATLAIGTPGATNAGLLAVAILGNKYPDYAEKLNAYRKSQADKIAGTKLPCES